MKKSLKLLLIAGILSLSSSLYPKDITIKNGMTSILVHNALNKNEHTYLPLEEGVKLFNGSLLTEEDECFTFMFPFTQTGSILVCVQPNELLCTYKVIDPSINYEGPTNSAALTYEPFYENDKLYMSLVDLSIFNLKTTSFQNGIYYLLDATAASL